MTKLKGQGMPVDSVESARAWRTERQNIAHRKPEPPPAGVRLPVHLGGHDDGPDADDMLDESFERARIRHKIAEANLAELEEARIKGLHVEKTRVEMGFFEAARGLRDGMTNCSRRIAAEVATLTAPTECEAVISRELRHLLESFTRQIAQKFATEEPTHE